MSYVINLIYTSICCLLKRLNMVDGPIPEDMVEEVKRKRMELIGECSCLLTDYIMEINILNVINYRMHFKCG